jgi:membrane protease YdiL (CAAX protease family)
MSSIPPPTVVSETPDRPDPASSGRSRDGEEPPWPAWTAPAAVLLGLALGIFGGVLVGVAGQANGSSFRHPTPAMNIIGDVVFDLGFVAAALYLASIHGRPRPSDFGFRRPRLKQGLIAFFAAGVGYYVLTAIYAALFHLHGKDKLPKELGVDKSTAALIGAAIFVCVIAPMAEEFFFRGFLFGTLKRWKGPWVAALLTGLLFGLAHTGSAASQFLVPLAFLGFVLCLVRWRTGSLYPCMALHSVNNALALGINQLHWNVGQILALMAGALLVIAVLTGPLSAQRGRAVLGTT